MAFCEQCGAQSESGAKFCTTCGAPARVARSDPSPPPPAAPLTAPGSGSGGASAPTREVSWDPPSASAGPRPSVALPAWLAPDWPLVGLCVLLMAGAMFGACAAYGAVLAVVAGGGLGALVDGATTGLYLAFAAFGGETIASSGPDLPSAFLGFQFLPLPLAALGPVATWLALRFAGSRLANDRTSLLAFAGKVAVTFGIVMAVLASVLSIGDPDERDGFAATVSGGEVWVYSTLIVGISALVFLRLRGVRILPARFLGSGAALLPYAGDGAKAFGLLALGMAPIGFIAAMIALDSGAERLGLLFGLLGVGFTIGIVGAAYAMGAAIALLNGHTSLLKFGFPPDSDAGAAPLPFFILLLVAPAIVAWVVQGRLERDRPPSEQDAIKIGFVTAIAFGLTAWFAALVSRVNLVAAVADDSGEGATAFLTAKPSPGAVLGLALLWGLVGGLGMALLWARQQGAGWRMSPPSFDAGGADEGATVRWAQPPDARPMAAGGADVVCPGCGAGVPVGSRFCARCGRSTQTSDR